MPARTASPSLFSLRTDDPRSGRYSPLRSWGTLAQLWRTSSASSPSGLGTTWITGCWSAWLWKTVGWWGVSTRTPTPVQCWKGKSLWGPSSSSPPLVFTAQLLHCNLQKNSSFMRQFHCYCPISRSYQYNPPLIKQLALPNPSPLPLGHVPPSLIKLRGNDDRKCDGADNRLFNQPRHVTATDHNSHLLSLSDPFFSILNTQPLFSLSLSLSLSRSLPHSDTWSVCSVEQECVCVVKPASEYGRGVNR